MTHAHNCSLMFTAHPRLPRNDLKEFPRFGAFQSLYVLDRLTIALTIPGHKLPQ